LSFCIGTIILFEFEATNICSNFKNQARYLAFSNGATLVLTLAQSGFRLLGKISADCCSERFSVNFLFHHGSENGGTSPFGSFFVSCQDLSPALDVATELRESLLPFVDSTRAGRRQWPP